MLNYLKVITFFSFKFIHKYSNLIELDIMFKNYHIFRNNFKLINTRDVKFTENLIYR